MVQKLLLKWNKILFKNRKIKNTIILNYCVFYFYYELEIN